MTGSLAVCPIQEVFNRYLQGGRIDIDPERVDFVTSPGFLDGGDARQRLGMPGARRYRPRLLRLRGRRDDARLSLHPGVTLKQVRAEAGWELRIAPHLATTEPPGEDELQVLRELDRDRLYLR